MRRRWTLASSAALRWAARADGGVLCQNCRAGKKQVVLVSAGVLRAMAQLADVDGIGWRRLEIDARSRGELRRLLNGYFTHLLGRKPRLHAYL